MQAVVVVTENIPEPDPEPIGYTLSGVWVFNTKINTTENIDYQKINFTMDGTAYYGIGTTYYSYTLPSGTFREEVTIVYGTKTTSDGSLANGILIAYDNSMTTSAPWSDTTYQKIDFGSTAQTVSEEFYNWFTSNATKQSANSVERKIWLTDGSYLMTADANSTWSEIIGSGLTIYDTQGGEWLLTIVGGYVKATWCGAGMMAPAGSISGMKIEGSMLFGAYSAYYYSNDGYIYYLSGNSGGSND